MLFQRVPQEEEDTTRVFDQKPVSPDMIVVEDEAQALLEMRQEAFSWPRIVAPPMKRSGHVVFDVCAASGNIERFTIPKSQGKQAYSDARKAHWGDLFPHQAKNGIEQRPSRKGPKRTKTSRFNDDLDSPLFSLPSSDLNPGFDEED